LKRRRARLSPYLGITTGTSIPTGADVFGPSTTPLPPGQIAITSITADSPAAEAGLDVGDILVAMDGDRVDAASFSDRVKEKKIGTTVQVTVTRRDRLIAINVPVGSREPITYSIKEKPDATELQKQIFTSWLVEKQL
jgi:predicted metalloprotease with PDZ domain